LGPTFNYDVAPDGRFVVIKVDQPPTLLFVENWFEELKRLVPSE